MYLIGQGIDTHNLIAKENQTVVLGGYSFLANYQVEAVSDGDVVLHSISNAILGALGLGDIGEYFSDRDPKNKNLDSTRILHFCLDQMKNYQIVNLDLTIQCEYIYLSSHKKHIKESLSKLLNTERVNIKATRYEKKIDQITCHSVVLLKKI